MPRAEVPWGDLGELATKLLLQIDGAASTATIATATGSIATPKECARELRALAQRGIVKLEPKVAAEGEDGEPGPQLDIDLTGL